jgi:hypothetical protein
MYHWPGVKASDIVSDIGAFHLLLCVLIWNDRTPSSLEKLGCRWRPQVSFKH